MATNQIDTADDFSPTVTGYGISYAVTSILSALLVVLKESYEGVMALLVSITGHHWVSHGLLAVIVFVALGALLSRRNIAMKGNTLITTVVGATVVGGLIVVGFFGL
ncbi:hypothetical protein MNBD_ALPHA09-1500 [hydrothermal vent metagenome]|uniref:Uncharacterized protein n=1 Tax=hydrothermal vent metagenome TaxID=652676 RepID=A0A3B0T6J5_9ZZZZ